MPERPNVRMPDASCPMPSIWQEFQPIAALATTPTGAQRLQPLCENAGATLWVPESITGIKGSQTYTGSLKAHLATLWPHHRAFIFCLATGATVRLIAPLLQHKSTDPAVVILDDTGKFAISLCGGHQAGADQLTRMIALQLGATPVLTGASAGLGLPAADMLGAPFGWERGAGDWTGVSAAVARGEAVQVIQQAGSTLWQSHLPQKHPFYFEPVGKNGKHDAFPTESDKGTTESDKGTTGSDKGTTGSDKGTTGSDKGTTGSDKGTTGSDKGTTGSDKGTTGSDKSTAESDTSANESDTGENPRQPAARLWITHKQPHPSHSGQIPEIHWHPRVLWVGAGCERGTSKQLIETAIQQTCQTHQLAESAIAGIATIDLKADEIGLVELCRQRNWPLRTFPAELLRNVPVPNPSATVEKEVATPSVAEAAALLAANPDRPSPNPQIPAPPPQPLLAPKQIYRAEGQPGAVTVAIAQSQQEYTGRAGTLLLIGTGPGTLEQITPAAQTAIARADAVIGYSLYIDLIAPLLHPGQIVESLPITQERQRANRAIELANFGLAVAVVSSGDCGIYGMAGLVLEELRAQNWDGKTPAVRVFPGITALQAAASRVGAPLMHDFCAISLSDLLTPWEVIEKRLIAAAMADFVTALYNPRSQTRTEQIVRAREIFLQHRDPNTPVAIVRSAYREEEQISLATLDKFLEIPIDMLTTVLIGNQSTRTHAGWMITPRGYLGFSGE
ncbi:precorrin-3B C(17)-methyltransferase [Kamptonema formosum]|uniref:precorrin-3B C(17)-methyltransferase n=1 Tax=Kamptonema formosum TaxID=331992 RepID=UPI00034B590D|nr:precorrin-3B C(17)-methyltransferase [Oscillatoria sp. PCC 10802]